VNAMLLVQLPVGNQTNAVMFNRPADSRSQQSIEFKLALRLQTGARSRQILVADAGVQHDFGSPGGKSVDQMTQSFGSKLSRSSDANKGIR